MAAVNDIVLIYIEDDPVSFARVESILPDAKKGWYHIKLLMLQIPLQVVTWILKDNYINGEQFHMNGKQMKLKKVESPVEELSFVKKPKYSDNMQQNDMNGEKNTKCKVISFADFKKRHELDDDAG